ncbi:MAG: class I SAM-dependent methyltransferase [Verrucomicrobia bacterium]|nr:class I SAM-dependent methyltransferase [Verrucomicrobiota bacterium]
MADKEKVKEQAVINSENFIDYYKGFIIKPKRSTVAFCDFVNNILPSTEDGFKAIEVGCGGGETIFHLSKILNNATWTGIDVAEKLLGYAKKVLPNEDRFNFIHGDLFDLSKMFPAGAFDLSFSIQTLTWLPSYEEAIEKMFLVTKKWIFVTSLFTDFNVDVYSNVFMYDKNWSKTNDSPYNYNIYSFNRFKSLCKKLGAKEVFAEDFIIDIDLNPPEDKKMGTYTLKQYDGARIQFSGPILMPWKMIAIKVG